MKHKLVKFICFYDTESHAEEMRNQSLAAHQKIEFLVSLLTDAGYSVEIISASQTFGRRTVFSRCEKVSSDVTLHLFASLGRSGYFSRVLRKWFGYFGFKRYLKKNLRSSDVVILYHSLEYLNFLLKLKKDIGFKLITEFEELYSDIQQRSRNVRRSEMNLAKISDALIVPSRPLELLINVNRVPSLILHGDYSIKPLPQKREDCISGVRVIYAGTFDPNQGIESAIKSALYLSSRFELIIAGFGSPRQGEQVIRLCNECQTGTDCKITFVGELPNSECERLIQKADIGLCVHTAGADYCLTSFPCKILTYLKNGVKVVSCKNESITSSDVSDLLYYYEGDDPADIAKAITDAARSPQCTEAVRTRLQGLYQAAVMNLSTLIDGENNDANECL